MELKARNVFIDTQSFKKMGLNFGHVALRQFAIVSKDGRLNHYMTSVVEREIRAHIDKAISDAVSSLGTFQRKARLLQELEDPGLRHFFQPIDEAKTKDKAQAVFSSFLEKAKTRVVPARSASLEKILDSYFQRLPPFADGKKKSEFPDAISMASLESKLKGDSIYVVSEDQDLIAFCDSNDQFIHVESLDKFLNIYNRHENALSELVLAQFWAGEDDIKEELAAAVGHLGVYNSAPWEDSDVEDFEIVSIDNLEPSVIYIDDEASIVTIEFEVTYTATVTGPDFLNGIYDSEDKCVYALRNTTNSTTETISLSAEVIFYYSVEGQELREVTRKQARLLDTNDIEVYVNEYDEVWG